MPETKFHAKIYVEGEAGFHPRVIRDIVQLKNPRPDGYAWHGMATHKGSVIIVGSMTQDSPRWYDLDIPMYQARNLMALYSQQEAPNHAT